MKFQMKRISVLVLVMISLWGCNEENKQNPAPQPENQTQTNRTNQRFTLTDNYVGQNLNMVFPSEGNFGLIQLGGEDARALYRAMALTTYEANTGTVLATFKASDKVRCDEITVAESEGISASISYECIIAIDYRAGSINNISQSSMADESVAELTQDYTSLNLFMPANDATHSGSILLTGEDARALYDTLSVEAVTSEDRSTKLTQDMMCAFLSITSVYVCKVNMNYRNGQIVQNVLPAPVVEESVTETPVVEQPVAEAPSTVPAEDVITIVTF